MKRLAAFVWCACLGAGCDERGATDVASPSKLPLSPGVSASEQGSAQHVASPATSAPGSGGREPAFCSFPDVGAPPTKAIALGSKQAWAVLPNSRGCHFDAYLLGIERYVRPQGEAQIVMAMGTMELAVPTVLVRAVARADVKPGDAVLANVMDAQFGRVVAAEGGGATIEWFGGAERPDTSHVELEQLVRLEDKVAFGQPVIVRDDHAAIVVAMASDQAWIINAGLGHSGRLEMIATKDLRPIRLMKRHANGAEVLSRRNSGGTLEPAHVVRAVGVAAYEVKYDGDGETQTHSFASVTARL